VIIATYTWSYPLQTLLYPNAAQLQEDASGFNETTANLDLEFSGSEYQDRKASQLGKLLPNTIIFGLDPCCNREVEIQEGHSS
jgi:hypothetical protein